MVVAFCGVLLFLFVPETFWDRKPIPKAARKGSHRPSFFRRYSSKHGVTPRPSMSAARQPDEESYVPAPITDDRQGERAHRVGFAPEPGSADYTAPAHDSELKRRVSTAPKDTSSGDSTIVPFPPQDLGANAFSQAPNTPNAAETDTESQSPSSLRGAAQPAYTAALRGLPPRSFVQQLRPFHGRLNKDKWYKVAVRPLILYSYPAVLWSAVVYSCSVGWLIVISESVSVIYREGHPFRFNALQAGLVYISPFIGGVLGTAVAGKVSDIIVKALARRNGGLYEPEFRLVMAIPITITTVLGLIGFGWSAQVHRHWMVPTAFFGIISFGCSLGSTTSITFCVDSYRQYAGEALVTLNFSKNIFHGLVFSLFVTGWLESDGPKKVYIWIGIIQLILMLFTIPMYIYGKRARMWTVRKNFMERF